ncbi:MAG TPA: DUF542 domain-containing protein [Chitinophagaceae bacterium]|nr:DUF542 domain-containing protein [Chitinophagaceae bacterium]
MAGQILTLSQMVQNDYRLADVFKKWTLNYCCGGNSSLDEACAARGINQEAIMEDMALATQGFRLPNTFPFNEWPFDFLIDYISHVHHSYIKLTGVTLQRTLLQFVTGHKNKYPHLQLVEISFNNLLTAVLSQTQRDEDFSFPYFKQIDAAYKQKAYEPGIATKLKQSSANMTNEDFRLMEQLTKALREATNDYLYSEHACTNHQVIYHKLAEFESNLVQQNYLKKHSLFPKAIQMEKELLRLYSSL